MISTTEEQEVEKPALSVEGRLHEKFSPDLDDGDEALRLLGVERATHFSEEYNEKLKRKLDRLIPPLASFDYTHVDAVFSDKTSLNCASIMGLPIVGQAKRISWFYVMNGITQIFGGFVAYGISFYDGHLLAPYKIIYILLGGLAIMVGICVLIWLPDSPVHANFLTKEERIAALERVRDDSGGTENKRLKWGQIVEAFTDIRTWLIVLTTLLTSIPNGGLSNFSNLIIKGFGYTSKQTLILSTPGGAVAALMTLLCGWYSDKKGERMIPIIFALVPTIVGSAMLIGLNHSGQKGILLFAVYLIGTFGSALSSVYAYNASNTSGHTKKSTINAMTLVAFSIGNIIGTEIFLPKDAPDYIPGKIAIMVLLTVQLAISLLLRWINIRMNRKKQAMIAEEKARGGWTDADVHRERERHAFADLTDKE
ncbi:hypothetical protein M413DRAFT_24017 [Hebeloma cylindrosporum]|uniref:Major facilitator superfamily (MFS) profile domain-containing protein n=1 Tax=Hebeloma cylindrosporum TaxID=76867 RepID=A0A0C2YZ62_HEBCY|nr:hypothetical protein M413DRAFT_24017 [Hebeloma cylindrosporum h7]